MNPLIQFKPTILTLLIPLVLACFALSPTARAQLPSPTPDGGYPNANTAEGANALFSLTTGAGNMAAGFDALFSNTSGNANTANGVGALVSNTTGSNNTATGAGALFSNTTISSLSGHDNTANGVVALFSNTTGSDNTADGRSALLNNTTGVSNTAVGDNALQGNTTGGENIALGGGAGSDLTTGSDNIDIGNVGVAGEADKIRIGTNGTHSATFIAGIRGVETGIMDAIGVVIDSAGQLGTASSSRRFKHDIKPMDKVSEAILALKPVTFHYKSDTRGTPQFGLIAEEVAAVNPDLVVRDKNGEIYTVRYDAVNAMLLNEFLKAHRKMEEAAATIGQLKSATDTLATTVKEQAAQIQKVSAQVEASRPAPQMVLSP